MKTIKKLVVLVMAVILMAGCTFKTNAGFKIAKDGKVAVTMIMAMDDEMIDTFLTISKMDQSELAGAESPDDIDVKEHTDAERWEFLESDDNSMFEDMDDMEGFEKAKYDKDGMKGYIFTKEVGTLDEITKDSATERVDVSEAIEDSKFSGKVLFTKNGDVYKSNMKITATEGTDQESLDQIKEYGGKLKAKWVYGMVIYNGEKINQITWNKSEFYFVDTPSEKRNPGYPLDSISIMPNYNKYFVDLTQEEKNQNNNEQIVFDFIIKNI